MNKTLLARTPQSASAVSIATRGPLLCFGLEFEGATPLKLPARFVTLAPSPNADP